jgi:hypothetical protein
MRLSFCHALAEPSEPKDFFGLVYYAAQTALLESKTLRYILKTFDNNEDVYYA